MSKNPPTPIGREYWLHGLHVDSWDNIWITDLGRDLVMKFEPDGKLLLTLGRDGMPGEEPDGFNQPAAVAVDPSGCIYVADGYGNSRIAKYSADGRLLLTWDEKAAVRENFKHRTASPWTTRTMSTFRSD